VTILCAQCHNPIPDGEQKTLSGALLCEDCYIKAMHPSTGKPHYKHDSAGFMRRLKTTHSVIKQEID
jgi:recombinational DNA repair protein (RecF pathway)